MTGLGGWALRSVRDRRVRVAIAMVLLGFIAGRDVGMATTVLIAWLVSYDEVGIVL